MRLKLLALATLAVLVADCGGSAAKPSATDKAILQEIVEAGGHRTPVVEATGVGTFVLPAGPTIGVSSCSGGGTIDLTLDGKPWARVYCDTTTKQTVSSEFKGAFPRVETVRVRPTSNDQRWWFASSKVFTATT